ncbi:MAG: acetate--CoA ligase family protein [Bacteroidales bacterium]|nr:acetate--CoA ligase family protein [Bacteroidales bacterium]
MINSQLINPDSIVVVGGSDDISKPGGKLLKNIIDGGFSGDLLVINPKSEEVQGVKSYSDPAGMPNADLAILAIAANYCYDVMEGLITNNNTRAFIILSAGFGEENKEGEELEQKIVNLADRAGASLIGPNCIGVLTQNYNGVFTQPVPKLDPGGVDFISGSGATAVFIMESAIPNGVTFSSLFSVGNSSQTGVEDVLKYYDETFDPDKSSKVKLVYIESVSKPDLLLKHAASLISKGCRIAAIKAGTSEAGSRAVSSHTGALANPDVAVDALFKKAGIIRCYSRQELAAVASVLMHPEPEGRNMAIVTHAGGPAVMMTDALSDGGMNIPHLEGDKAESLLEKLFPGSSVSNPIDFLATGNAGQLGHILDACENDFDNIDAVAVIFGSPGLFPVDEVYNVLDSRMTSSGKPIYPVLPSLIMAGREVSDFLAKGRINFPDEVVFAKALIKVVNRNSFTEEQSDRPIVDEKKIREIIDHASNGYLSPVEIRVILDAAGIERVEEAEADTVDELVETAGKIGYPLVMKVVGPVHKSDVGGVVLNVNSLSQLKEEFNRLMKMPDAVAVMLQPMLGGTELFAGAKKEGKFGHLVLCGLGGIYIEVLKDINAALVPVGEAEAKVMIETLKGYKILKGIRGDKGVNIEKYIGAITRLSRLLEVAPEICELDLNPLLGTSDNIIAVDARIRVERRKAQGKRHKAKDQRKEI